VLAPNITLLHIVRSSQGKRGSAKLQISLDWFSEICDASLELLEGSDTTALVDIEKRDLVATNKSGSSGTIH
jgi:hypothetical protein